MKQPTVHLPKLWPSVLGESRTGTSLKPRQGGRDWALPLWTSGPAGFETSGKGGLLNWPSIGGHTCPLSQDQSRVSGLQDRCRVVPGGAGRGCPPCRPRRVP